MPVLLEAHLLDESSHAAVYRNDVLLYLCIVGIFDAPEMHESGAYPHYARQYERQDYYVECDFFGFSVHDLRFVKGFLPCNAACSN